MRGVGRRRRTSEHYADVDTFDERAGWNNRNCNEVTMPPRVLRQRKPVLKAPLPLPHERDESPDISTPTRPIMRQAKRDLDAGQVDTDNYTRVAAASAGRLQQPRRTRRTA